MATPTMPMRSVAVLGAGTMGAQIAAHFANAGVPVLLLDVSADAAREGLKRARGLKPDPFFTADAAALITTGSFDADLAKIAGADWTLEAVVEQIDIKRSLLERIDAVRRPRTIVTSNTSGIPIATLAESRSDDIRRHAGELVAEAPDVILAHGSSTVGPLLQATRTVPIVFPVVVDPVGAGFVDSLARPGGNATGFMAFEYTLSGKWLELLKQIAPGVTRGPSGSCHPVWDRPVRRHPGRGTVAQGRGLTYQYARRRRDRPCRRGLRAFSERWPDRNDGRGCRGASSRSDHHACDPAQTSGGLFRTLLRRCRRPDLLWA